VAKMATKSALSFSMMLVLCASPTVGSLSATSFVSSPHPLVLRPSGGSSCLAHEGYLQGLSRPQPRERVSFPNAAPHLRPQPALSRRQCPEQLISRCVAYGTKEYWDDMYRGEGEVSKLVPCPLLLWMCERCMQFLTIHLTKCSIQLPAEQFSWYCGWVDLAKRWEEFVPSRSANVLVPGIGNDGCIVDLFDAGVMSRLI